VYSTLARRVKKQGFQFRAGFYFYPIAICLRQVKFVPI